MPVPRRPRLFVAAIGLGAAVLAAAELTHWAASRRGLGAGPPTGGLEAVVVLGFRNGGTRANLVNRWRVRAGIRSLSPGARDRVLVLCGGAVAGTTPEAELMQRYARDELGYTGEILVEPESRTTSENIRNALPLIEDAATIKIVSNAIHAAVGRALLREQRPALAGRLRRGDDYRFGEQPLIKVYAMYRGLRHHLVSRSARRPQP